MHSEERKAMIMSDTPRDPSRRPIAVLSLAVALVCLVGCGASEQKAAAAPPAGTGPLAFPGAQGYGAHAAGGRGGRVIAVDTLADSGAGSLRSFIVARGQRICIFRVSGVIRFTRRPPVIREPFLTIAGQTAPGGGIILAHAGGPEGFTPLLIKNTHDIVVRDIRVRPNIRGDFRGANDAITFENSRNIMLDHVSGSWALDENINGQSNNDNVTISWSIFAEGIPGHDKCALLGSDPTGPQKMTFMNNLCAHNGDRNPDMNFTPGSCIDVINNIFYDAGSQFAEVWESYCGSWVNIVRNMFRAGPSTSPSAVGLDRQEIGSRGPARVYIEGNHFDGEFLHQAGTLAAVLVDKPVCPLSIQPVSAQEAYNAVLKAAGAFPRDAVDQRIVAEVRARTGHIRKAPGAMPSLAAGKPYADRDGDGMSDAWEQAHGTNPDVADAWANTDANGFSNLDRFLYDAHHMLMAGRTVE
jgi:pectate lyase